MTEEEFEKEKYAYFYCLLKNPETLFDQARIYEQEIFNKHYNFNHAKTDMETLQLITKSDIIQFYYVSFSEIVLYHM